MLDPISIARSHTLSITAVILGTATLLGHSLAFADEPIDLIVKLYGLAAEDGGLSESDADAVKEFAEQRQVIAQFLKRRRISATDEAIDRRIDSVERLLAKEGKTLDEALAAIGASENQLRSTLAVPIAWNAYLRLVLTEEAIQKEFDTNRSRYDGTRVEIAQIFLGANPTTTNPSATRDEPQQARADEAYSAIQSGSLTFAEAVKKYSDSPSKNQDGRIGAIRYRGDTLPEIAEWAFAADVGDLSEPITTSLGVHVIKVLAREPGTSSLEDARASVITALSDRLWSQAIQREQTRG